MGIGSKTFLTFMSIVTLIGCSQGSMSERDARLEQLRLQAEAKRRELQQVVGDYEGESLQSSGATHEIFLRLEIKDIPTAVEGQPEPVMMPALAGFVRFYLGASGSTEFIVFAIDKSGFDVSSNRIEVTSSHPEYKELLVSFARNEPELEGNWTAPSMASSGTMSLKRVPNVSSELGDL